ncbi:MAG: adenosine kinase [Proteobacteria bacterium]|nr:adenosine kinase [Pseudomonadota bacterium]MDA0845641.1 adenosine kinase [Pseudomonadota bacterium]
MPQKSYDILAVGNAIIDVFSQCDDDFLQQHAIEKGGMSLVDAAASQSLLAAISAIAPPQLTSGGSAANTAVGLAALGGKAAFVGRVHDDELGTAFCRDIKAAGVTFAATPAQTGAPTASSIILVTPDAARSMNTFLGASIEFQPEDIQLGATADAAVIYLEGYLFDAPAGPAIFAQAAQMAAQNQARIALSLSDPWCVDRHRADLRQYVTDHVDILFANEDEAISLVETDHATSVQMLRGLVDEVVITRGPLGAVVCHAGQQILVDAMPQGPVIDTTGAGDLFASGYLFGRTHGYDAQMSGQIASMLAGEVISHIGARPHADLQALIKPLIG